MNKIVNLDGKKFGRLTVIGKSATSTKYHLLDCKCDCGKTTTTRRSRLLDGVTKSCGCLKSEVCKTANKKHGFSSNGKRRPEYVSWSSMRARCYNQKHEQYKRYGGAGTSVCERWRNNFDNFLLDMGKKPSPKHTIDRINNDGNYEPSNCRWATATQQANNTSFNVNLEFLGIKKSASQWARHFGIGVSVIYSRIKMGWDIDRVLSHPVKGYKLTV